METRFSALLLLHPAKKPLAATNKKRTAYRRPHPSDLSKFLVSDS
jgi:hypothetical protein